MTDEQQNDLRNTIYAAIADIIDDKIPHGSGHHCAQEITDYAIGRVRVHAKPKPKPWFDREMLAEMEHACVACELYPPRCSAHSLMRRGLEQWEQQEGQ